ncbi:MAG: alpha/beta hydrolase [Lachnospiraceae bacterium]|nr:alpha/beta hydrolase [Lachnospiraceae bacterium]
MRTEIVNLNSRGEGNDVVLGLAEEIAEHYSLEQKKALHLRLLTEEMIELVKSLAGDFESAVYMESNKNECELNFKVKTIMDEEKRKKILLSTDNLSGETIISEKVRTILETGPYLYKKGESIEEEGIIKAEADVINEIGDDISEKKDEAYVWSLQSYAMSSFYDEENNINPEKWKEVRRSIIANIADDVRIYIFKDIVQVIAVYKYDEQDRNDLPIDPQFDPLKKIPVAGSVAQVKMVQLLFKNLPKKEASTEELAVTRIKIPSAAAPKGYVRTLIYEPKEVRDDDNSQCVLFIHGGAMVMPALPYHYRLARKMAKEARCRVIMPDYHLGPKYTPPIQYNEIFDVYTYMLENAKELKISTDSIAVAGDSAGGTLAVALCLMARDRGVKMPLAQLLFYPSLDSRLESDSMKKYTSVPVCNATAIKEYYKMCRPKGEEANSILSSPVEAQSLSGLPDAYVETAEFDALHDDGVLYANRLRDEGGNVVLNETKGTVHAFDMAKSSKILADAMSQRIMFLRRVFGMA